MSQAPTSAGSPGGPASARTADEEKTARSIYLVSYPKVVFLYPTFIAAIVAGIYMAIVRDMQQDRTDTHILSTIFLAIFGLNLVILSFDFPRTTSLTLFFCIAAVVLGLLLLFRLNDQILPALHNLLTAFQPVANATFYFSVAGILGLIYLAVLINIQFDYWEVTPNELLHHHGMLSNLERFSAPSLKIDKEITDVFEYALLRSGRLILHPSSEPRAIVLENVPRINAKQARLTRMLGALQVQLRPATPGE
ncbi:MAG TPA: hypothetical protein VL475_02470 [Planctomycetaceae bacterium]|nr:hypothetical protein [Planctomycetaceae bacterium]